MQANLLKNPGAKPGPRNEDPGELHLCGISGLREPQTLNPKPETLNPKPETPSPKPQTPVKGSLRILAHSHTLGEAEVRGLRLWRVRFRV